MHKVLRYASIGMATLGMGLGVAAADSASIGTTGPESNNQVKINTNRTASVRNNNDVNVDNHNSQRAYSGDAVVNNNTEAGDATSGDARNSNATETKVTLSNGFGGAGMGNFWSGGNAEATIHLTGPNSNNQIEFNNTNRLTVKNDNNVEVNNHNYQKASSGDATVNNNTLGGDATSGSASNTNNTSTSVQISN